MLKIKNEIDLNVLEQFGFTTENKNEYVYKTSFGYSTDVGVMDASLYVDKERRTLSIRNTVELEYANWEAFEEYNDVFLSIVYDLIQAGLVEKVE